MLKKIALLFASIGAFLISFYYRSSFPIPERTPQEIKDSLAVVLEKRTERLWSEYHRRKKWASDALDSINKNTYCDYPCPPCLDIIMEEVNKAKQLKIKDSPWEYYRDSYLSETIGSFVASFNRSRDSVCKTAPAVYKEIYGDALGAKRIDSLLKSVVDDSYTPQNNYLASTPHGRFLADLLKKGTATTAKCNCWKPVFAHLKKLVPNEKALVVFDLLCVKRDTIPTNKQLVNDFGLIGTNQ